jgi:uncharacterized membrane protein
MSTDRHRPPRIREAPGTYALVGVILLVTMVALLAVPTYSHLTPSIGGVPFFYWYTLMWLVVNALLQVIAYQILARAGRRGDRA